MVNNREPSHPDKVLTPYILLATCSLVWMFKNYLHLADSIVKVFVKSQLICCYFTGYSLKKKNVTLSLRTSEAPSSWQNMPFDLNSFESSNPMLGRAYFWEPPSFVA